MHSILDLLYDHAMENFDQTLGLLEEWELCNYHNCKRVIAQQEDKLLALIPHETFEKYDDLINEQTDYVRRAMFRSGLVLGLRLGALAIR